MSLLEKIKSHEAEVAVIGIGYVGLPLATEMAHAGFRTVGYDKSEEKVRSVNPFVAYAGPFRFVAQNISSSKSVQLAGINPEEYEAQAERIAPAFARLPGLIAKVWLADPGEETYGGVYLWTDRAAAEAYADGELLAARRNPAFAGFRSSILDTLAAPTALTARGLAGLSLTEAPCVELGGCGIDARRAA